MSRVLKLGGRLAISVDSLLPENSSASYRVWHKPRHFVTQCSARGIARHDSTSWSKQRTEAYSASFPLPCSRLYTPNYHSQTTSLIALVSALVCRFD